MHLKAIFRYPKVGWAKFERAIHETLSEALVQGAFTWLMTAIEQSTSVGLPIWSAASIATFSPLAHEIGTTLAMTPVGRAPDRVSMGLANGEATFHPGDQTPGLYTFSYSTTLNHLIINESYDATQWGFHLTHPGPYHFQEKANQAFLTYASRITLPGWSEIADIVTIHVG